jgi:hypothetical protein
MGSGPECVLSIVNYQSMMSTYHKNLKVLKSRFPDLVDIVNRAHVSGLSIQPARMNGFSLRTPEGISLHSRINPHREAENLVRSRGIFGGGHVIAFGFGLGYHLQAAAAVPGGIDTLIAVEFCPCVVKTALEHIDLTDLLAWSGFDLWLPGIHPPIQQRIVDLGSNVKMLIHPPSLALWRRRKLPLTDILDRMELRRMNENYSGKAYREAVERNTTAASTSQDVESYFGRIDNRPVVIAAAGPSLDDAKPLIKKYRPWLLLLAVNAAFLPLRKAGIRPDAVVCVEPRPAAAASFDGEGEENIPLIFTPSTNPDVVANWHGPKLLAYHVNSAPSTTTGTVAGTALDVAFRLGANPIILTGLDLALSHNWYAKGVAKPAQETAAKSLSTSLMKNRSPEMETRTVEGVDGSIIPTTRAFQYFVHCLERMIEHMKLHRPDLRIFDLKTNGARLNGTQPMPPTEQSMRTILRNVTPHPTSTKLNRSTNHIGAKS